MKITVSSLKLTGSLMLSATLSLALSSGMHSAQATVFHYDASVTPDDSSLQSVFSTRTQTGTSWSASGGELMMTTADLKGIWFGNHPTFDPVPWELGSSLEGNSVSWSAKLLPNSEDWEVVLYDGSYVAWARLFPGELQFWHSGGTSAYAVDTLAFHSYAFNLTNGLVTYSVDDFDVFSGAADPLTTAPTLVIGDGSATGNRTIGSWIVDDVTIRTGISTVPVPAAFFLFGSGLLTLASVRRISRKSSIRA